MIMRNKESLIFVSLTLILRLVLLMNFYYRGDLYRMSMFPQLLASNTNPLSYGDFFAKYPPGMVYLLYIFSFLFGSSFIALKMMYTTCDLINIILISLIGYDLKPLESQSIKEQNAFKFLIFYSINPYVISMLINSENEVIPVVFFNLSLYFILKKKYLPSILASTIGFLIKILPGILVIPLIIDLYRKKEIRKLIFSISICILTILIFYVPLFFIWRDYGLENILYPLNRQHTGGEYSELLGLSFLYDIRVSILFTSITMLSVIKIMVLFLFLLYSFCKIKFESFESKQIFIVIMISALSLTVLQNKENYFFYSVPLLLYFESFEVQNSKYYKILIVEYIIIIILIGFLSFFSHQLPVSWLDSANTPERAANVTEEIEIYSSGFYNILKDVILYLTQAIWIFNVVYLMNKKHVSVYVVRALKDLLVLVVPIFEIFYFCRKYKKIVMY